MGDSESSHSRAQACFQLSHSPTLSGLRDALLEPIEMIKGTCKEETLDQSDQRILGPCTLSPACFCGSLDAFFFNHQTELFPCTGTSPWHLDREGCTVYAESLPVSGNAILKNFLLFSSKISKPRKQSPWLWNDHFDPECTSICLYELKGQTQMYTETRRTPKFPITHRQL